MAELKTLKDIREKAIKDICKNIKAGPEDLCSFGALGLMSVKDLVTTFLKADLRQEAIKHIQKLNRDLSKPGMSGYTWNHPKLHIIKWITDFFNIKKEDLK